MICRTCRLNLLSLRTALPTPQTSRSALSIPLLRRPYSTPAAESTPESSSSSSVASESAPKTDSATPKVVSSCPAGTPLLGLNYFKNKPDLIAGDDAEYPAWLWGLLDKGKKKGVQGSEIDTSTMNRKQRKRHEKKLAARMAAQPKVIPLHEQAIDIVPAGAEDGGAATQEGIQKRREITKSARQARRKAIKEDNFLRGM